jgi:hypothetical protein
MLGLWLLVAPWVLTGATAAAAANEILSGLLFVALSLPRGSRSAEHYGTWDRFIV